MKGVSQTLWIVIAIVVFLVIALVVLTIFGTSVAGFGSITQAQAFCESTAATSCLATGALPASWSAPNVRVTGEQGLRSCQSLSNYQCGQTGGGGATDTCGQGLPSGSAGCRTSQGCSIAGGTRNDALGTCNTQGEICCDLR